jgi:transcriptional regulator with XRE-family HTH domain
MQNSKNTTAKQIDKGFEAIQSMSLPSLRKSLRLPQQEIASRLNLNQAEISKMERRSDMYVSTLQNYINALGAKLELFAIFPNERVVRLEQFNRGETATTQKNTEAQTEKTTQVSAKRSKREDSANKLWWLGPGAEAKEHSTGIPHSTKQKQTDDNWFQKSLYQSV